FGTGCLKKQARFTQGDILDENTSSQSGLQTFLNQSFELPKLNVPFYFILTILLLYVLLGTITFCVADEWTVVQCVYSIVITLTTIGLGDIQPGYKEWTTQKGQIINLALIFYIMGGLSLMAMTVRMMASSVYAKCMKVIDSAGNMTKIKKCCY
uniref:Potassium channel domain-containing protein n=1 Tax=Romanomermis culicivorax TaxID=13658 RepID=A0A915I559_ROMCU